MWLVVPIGLHAVALDAFYDTTAEIIRETYRQAFAAAAAEKCRTIASAFLGCGYGRVSPDLFLSAICELRISVMLGTESVQFISTDVDRVGALRSEIESRRNK